MKRIITVLLVISFFCSQISYASNKSIGKVIKYKGIVQIYKKDSIKPIQINKKNFPIYLKDIVNTKSRSLAFIGFIDGSKVLLKEKSSLIVEDYRKLNINKGKVIFKIRKRGGLKGISVKVKSVVIGVKGTKFLVDTTDGKTKVFLKEGKISVKNEIGEFKVYKKKQDEEFAEFMKEYEQGVKQEQDEFEEYKKQVQKEFIEYVKEFEMTAGSAVIIDGNEVKNIKITPEIEKEFRLLDELDNEI